MTSLESATVRRNMRIVEHVIIGFTNAREAIIFGNTVEKIVNDKTGFINKYRQFISAPNTVLAITQDWIGPTTLNMKFLGLRDQNLARFICEEVKLTVKLHEEAHRTVLHISNEVIREKPQPQFLTR